MNYDRMTQMALRGVVRDALRRVIREGKLPGAHHFYITLLTRYPGVDIDAGLVEKYPEEITIVLEHQFWDLQAHNDSFEVTLKFGGVPKYLSVPYTAITRFHDPSVGFAMQFDPPEEMQSGEKGMRVPTLAKLRPQSKESAHVETTSGRTSPAKAGKSQNKKAQKSPKGTSGNSKTKRKDEADNKVVSLDSFRKK